MEVNKIHVDDFTNELFELVSYFRVNLRGVSNNKKLFHIIKKFLTQSGISWELLERSDELEDWYIRFIGPSLQEIFHPLPPSEYGQSGVWVKFYDLDPASYREGRQFMKGNVVEDLKCLLITPKGELFSVPYSLIWMLQPWNYGSSGSSGYSTYTTSITSYHHRIKDHVKKSREWIREKKRKDQLRGKVIAQANKKILHKGGFKSIGFNRVSLNGRGK